MRLKVRTADPKVCTEDLKVHANASAAGYFSMISNHLRIFFGSDGF
jgi:hypothetical protein